MNDAAEYSEYPEHIFNFRVPLSYFDMAGVIYNGNYLDIYDQARDAYLRDIGFSYTKLYKEANCHLSVVEVNIKYRQPVYYDELIEIITKVKKIGTKSLIFDQMLYKEQRQQLCNTATFALVCTNSSRKPVSLPEELKAAIKLHQAQT
ncbi:MAG: acyl-CoA thioesterase [Desulfobacteraceae bacterium]|nr:acyl-CoA thioesterase [Desulfobacteraceae bacterium]